MAAVAEDRLEGTKLSLGVLPPREAELEVPRLQEGF